MSSEKENLDRVLRDRSIEKEATEAILRTEPGLHPDIVESVAKRIRSRLAGPSGAGSLESANLRPFIEQGKAEFSEREKFETDLQRKRNSGMRWP